MNSSIRRNILEMHPYQPGKPVSEVQRELGLTNIVKLASNENPLGPARRAIEAVREAADQMHSYPDGSAFELKRAISGRFGVDVANIIVGNGSDNLIHLLGLVFLGSPDDEVIVGDPSFIRYDATANLAPCNLIRVPLDGTFTHDLTAMRAAVTENTKLIFIANPNNPTGTIVRAPELSDFLSDLPEQVYVVLDEAYFEFAEDVTGYPKSTDFLRNGHRIIGLRTFSKTYGLAGIRIGYGFAPIEIVDAIDRVREPFGVNSLAMAAARGALDDSEHIQATVRNNARGIERVTKMLERVGATVCESYANFVFADLGEPCAPLVSKLLQKGIIIRGGGIFGTPNCVRISIGTDAEHDRLEAALSEVAG
ncbi:MAG: histidinol-phosphate transaminase [Fimbriimonadaceae bacterium]